MIKLYESFIPIALRYCFRSVLFSLNFQRFRTLDAEWPVQKFIDDGDEDQGNIRSWLI